ncbi:MAG: tetratricopeptide repeat protein [Planctomycetaceae bacterium]|nr:tetratricopeptide repeat protein [Planctomycetaceae bacterium]
MSMTRFTAVILMASLLTGCTSSGSRWPSFAKRDNGPRKNLKDPSKLDLAYAKWQEQLGNMTEARERYQRVLHDEPQSVDALLGLARMDQLAGRLTEAEQGFRKALKTSPNDPLVLDALGQFYAAQEKWPQAIDVLKQALQTAPNDNTVRFHLAVATAKSGDLATAKPHFVNSVGEAEAEYNLGLILHDQGKLELAEQHFVQATVKKPTLEQAQYWLNEIRIEKETKNLLVGTSASVGNRPRPEMEAPAGALSSNTKLAATQVTEHRISANDLLAIQQTAAQQPYSAPRSGVAPAVNSLPSNVPPTARSANVSNPFATGTALPTINGGLTPQQLEQLRTPR